LERVTTLDTPELVTIRGGLSSLDAGALKLRLERAGIYCHLANEYTAKLSRGQVGGVWIQVPSTQVERATTLLATDHDELPEIDADLLEAEAEDSELCPTCDSDQIEYASGAGNSIAGNCRACGHQWTLT